jgi:hypothetical protein
MLCVGVVWHSKAFQQGSATNSKEIPWKHPTTRLLIQQQGLKIPRCRMMTSLGKVLVVGCKTSLWQFSRCSLSDDTLSGDLVIGGTTVVPSY